MAFRSPFVNDREYMEKQIHLLKLCIEMAFTAHRDKFSQTPVTTIRNNCEKLVQLADYIIQVMLHVVLALLQSNICCL